MLLTEADKQKVLTWVNTKCGQMRCVCCGEAKWTLMDLSSLVIGFDLHTTRFHYHQGMPLISIACTNCAHVIFFNSAMMGFKPDDQSPEQAAPGV